MRCGVQEARAARTLAETKQRIFDLMITPSISCRLLFQFAPVAIRRMFMSEQDISASPVKVRICWRLPPRCWPHVLAPPWSCWPQYAVHMLCSDISKLL